LRFLASFILSLGIIEAFLAFFIAINIFTFILYFIDKQRAIKHKWRISEKMLLFFTIIGGLGAISAMYAVRHKTRKKKFKIAATIGVIIAIIPIIHIAHALTFDRIIVYREIEFHSRNWPANLDGYRIAFITDKHVIPDAEMRDVASRLNEKNIDLLLLGGDFSMGKDHFIGTMREISTMNAPDGIFGVEGNHDRHSNFFGIKEYFGITPLDNIGIHIHDGFYLAGVSDLWTGRTNVDTALLGANDEDFVLLVSHNPDVSMRQPNDKVDLMLSGHTHAGQITFFGYPIYLLTNHISLYGINFAHGFTETSYGTTVFTSSGIGIYYNTPRIFARPEVVIFTMYSE